MKLAFFVLLLLLSDHSIGQATRGGEASNTKETQEFGESFALIVGISNYPNVTPLNYASEDALLFYNFLLSQGKGKIDTTNIRLLIDEDATAAAIMTKGISWLQNTAQPKAGDRVYFYLAGHGDAVDASEAYFLAYDANPAGDKNNYSVSGTINIQVLKNRIKKFTQTGVEVILIVDACRTADIPGGENGIAGNYESIIEQKSGELMMLSASPNQFSYEDKSFGNGHGLFTWHLINGLSGKADSDEDQNITLFELDNYVKIKVRNDSKQYERIQSPVFCCSNFDDKIVGYTDSKFLSHINSDIPAGADVFSNKLMAARNAVDQFDFVDQHLKSAYFDLKKYCKEQNKEAFRKADSLYSTIAEKYKGSEIHKLRDFYTTALIDEVQRAINAILYNQHGVTGDFDNCDYYEIHHAFLKKAIEINKISRPEMFDEYQNRLAFLEIKMWFDGKVALSSTYGPDSKYITYKKNGETIRDDSLNVIRENIEKCKLLIENGYDNALVHYTMAQLLSKLKMYKESAEYARNAIQHAPNWSEPYYHIVESYVQAGQMDSAEFYVLKKFDLATSANRFDNLAYYYHRNTNDTMKIINLYKQSIAQNNILNNNGSYPDISLTRHYDERNNLDSALYFYNIRKIYMLFPQKSFIATYKYQALIDTVETRLIKGDTTVSSLVGLFYVYKDVFQNKKKSRYVLDMAKNYYPKRFDTFYLDEFGNEINLDYNPESAFYLMLGQLHMSLNSNKVEEYLNLAEKLSPESKNGMRRVNPINTFIAYYAKNHLYEKQLKLELDQYNENKSTVNAIRLAQIYSNINDTINARIYLEKALDLDPYWHSRMYHISKIYKEIGELDLYDKYYQKALELGYSPKRKDDLNTLYGTVVTDKCD